MNTVDDGGLAFPVLGEANGMSLRDYFAAAALTGLLTQSQGSVTVSIPATGAKYAYVMADAMLAARKPTP